jgi:hypothetical protein
MYTHVSKCKNDKKKKKHYLKNKRAGDMAQEPLPSMFEALSSTPSTAKNGGTGKRKSMLYIHEKERKTIVSIITTVDYH